MYLIDLFTEQVKGLKRSFEFAELYHFLMRMSASQSLALFGTGFALVALVFAVLLYPERMCRVYCGG